MARYATADEHYFHEGMITHCGRPFDNVHEMNNFIIKCHNRTVGKND